MKAYVIKRYDGKYMSESGWFETNELWQAQLFDSKEIASQYCRRDDVKVVEVEIKEIQEQEEDDDFKCYSTGCDYCINYKCSRGYDSERDCMYHTTKPRPKGVR